VGLITTGTKLLNNLGHVVHTYVPLSPSREYQSRDGDVLQLETVTAGLPESNGMTRESPAGLLSVHRDQLRAQRLLMGELYLNG